MSEVADHLLLLADIALLRMKLDARGGVQLTRVAAARILDALEDRADASPVDGATPISEKCPNLDCVDGRIRGTAVGCAVCATGGARPFRIRVDKDQFEAAFAGLPELYVGAGGFLKRNETNVA